MTVTVPLFTEPLADPNDTATFPARAAVNFLETNTVFRGANLQNAENNAINANVNARSTAAESAAAAAAVSAAAAAASSTAANWVSGTTYEVGNVRRSLIDGLPYKRITAGAGTTDPRSDPANWLLDFLQIDSGLPNLKPTLLLDPVNSGVVDSRIVCTRGSTATYFDKLGVMRIAPANTLRIDHDPVTGECLGYLLEPSSTNLCTSSQGLSSWGGSAAKTLSTETYRGLATFYNVTRVGSTIEEAAQIALSAISAGTTLTLSVALLAGTSYKATVGLSGTVTAGSNWGLPSDCSCEIIEGSGVASLFTGTTGGLWTITGLSSDTPTVVRITRFFPAVPSSIPAVYIYPDGGASREAGKSIKATRVQVEAGVTYPTSYIPTSGSAATRAADVATIDGTNFSEFYNTKEGTITVNASCLGDPPGAVYPVALRNGSASSDVIAINQGAGVVISNSITQANLSGPGINKVFFKSALSYKDNQFLFSKDGSGVLSDFSGSAPNNISNLRFYVSNTASLGVRIKGVAYYPRAASASEVQALSRN